MYFGASEVQRLVESIWSAVLGWEVSAGTAPAGPEEFLTGCVPIAGAWDGAVLLDCHGDLARRAAGVMFGLGSEAADPEAVRDALDELTNMLGGNLKALLPGPCHLGLPTVVSGQDFAVSVPASRPVLQVNFRCQNLPLLARVVVRDPSSRSNS